MKTYTIKPLHWEQWICFDEVSHVIEIEFETWGIVRYEIKFDETDNRFRGDLWVRGAEGIEDLDYSFSSSTLEGAKELARRNIEEWITGFLEEVES